MSGMTKRRVLYIATAVAMMGLTGGFVLAAGLTSTTVSQNAALYSVSTSAVSGFPNTPTITVTATPASVASCSSSSVALTNGASVNLYLGASSGVTCTTNDFAEEFTMASSATAASGSYSFVIYTSYNTGSALTGSASGTITIATTLTSAGTVNVFVDYGNVVPPSGGIQSLSLVVQ
jgi:hypothetical protein